MNVFEAIYEKWNAIHVCIFVGYIPMRLKSMHLAMNTAKGIGLKETVHLRKYVFLTSFT